MAHRRSMTHAVAIGNTSRGISLAFEFSLLVWLSRLTSFERQHFHLPLVFRFETSLSWTSYQPFRELQGFSIWRSRFMLRHRGRADRQRAKHFTGKFSWCDNFSIFPFASQRRASCFRINHASKKEKRREIDVFGQQKPRAKRSNN